MQSNKRSSDSDAAVASKRRKLNKRSASIFLPDHLVRQVLQYLESSVILRKGLHLISRQWLTQSKAKWSQEGFVFELELRLSPAPFSSGPHDEEILCEGIPVHPNVEDSFVAFLESITPSNNSAPVKRSKQRASTSQQQQRQQQKKQEDLHPPLAVPANSELIIRKYGQFVNIPGDRSLGKRLIRSTFVKLTANCALSQIPFDKIQKSSIHSLSVHSFNETLDQLKSFENLKTLKFTTAGDEVDTLNTLANALRSPRLRSIEVLDIVIPSFPYRGQNEDLWPPLAQLSNISSISIMHNGFIRMKRSASNTQQKGNKWSPVLYENIEAVSCGNENIVALCGSHITSAPRLPFTEMRIFIKANRQHQQELLNMLQKCDPNMRLYLTGFAHDDLLNWLIDSGLISHDHQKNIEVYPSQSCSHETKLRYFERVRKPTPDWRPLLHTYLTVVRKAADTQTVASSSSGSGTSSSDDTQTLLRSLLAQYTAINVLQRELNLLVKHHELFPNVTKFDFINVSVRSPAWRITRDRDRERTVATLESLFTRFPKVDHLVVRHPSMSIIGSIRSTGLRSLRVLELEGAPVALSAFADVSVEHLVVMLRSFAQVVELMAFAETPGLRFVSVVLDQSFLGIYRQRAKRMIQLIFSNTANRTSPPPRVSILSGDDINEFDVTRLKRDSANHTFLDIEGHAQRRPQGWPWFWHDDDHDSDSDDSDDDVDSVWLREAEAAEEEPPRGGLPMDFITFMDAAANQPPHQLLNNININIDVVDEPFAGFMGNLPFPEPEPFDENAAAFFNGLFNPPELQNDENERPREENNAAEERQEQQQRQQRAQNRRQRQQPQNRRQQQRQQDPNRRFDDQRQDGQCVLQ